MASRLRLVAAVAATVSLLAGGCGGDEPPAATTSASETADRAKLPRSWQRHTNFNAGVSLGIPSLWRAQDRGITTIVHSPDRLLAITITADRTAEAIGIDAGEFATRVAESLAGYKSLKSGQARGFRHAYDAAAVAARGRTKAGIDQDVLVVVLSREGIAKITTLTAWNRAKTPERDVGDAKRILRMVRTRPVA